VYVIGVNQSKHLYVAHISQTNKSLYSMNKCNLCLLIYYFIKWCLSSSTYVRSMFLREKM